MAFNYRYFTEVYSLIRKCSFFFYNHAILRNVYLRWKCQDLTCYLASCQPYFFFCPLGLCSLHVLYFIRSWWIVKIYSAIPSRIDGRQMFFSVSFPQNIIATGIKHFAECVMPMFLIKRFFLQFTWNFYRFFRSWALIFLIVEAHRKLDGFCRFHLKQGII